MDAMAIEAKLEGYRTQLAQVDAAISTDPSNALLLKVRDDLGKLIALNQQLLDSLSSSTSSSSSSSKKRPLETDAGEDGAGGNNSDEQHFDSRPLPPPPPPSSRTGPIAVGDVIEALGGERPYAGIVTRLDVEPDGITVGVRYFELPDSDASVPLVSVRRPLVSSSGTVPREAVVAGLRCLCKYAADQQFYEAEVVEVRPMGSVVVIFTKYGNREEVPIEYLRQLPKTSSSSSSSAAAGNLPAVPSLIKIPDKLQILPTDTEEEKARKKKKLKSLNYKNKLITQETELVAVQHSWKQFQQKGAKKSLAGLVKGSQFATPEELGGRVGVVGSGKGVTVNPEKKKYTLNAEK